jgi:hypothetical protein
MQFTATGTFDDGQQEPDRFRDVEFHGAAYREHEFQGLARGVAPGVPTITASSGSIHGTTSLTIMQH